MQKASNKSLLGGLRIAIPETDLGKTRRMFWGRESVRGFEGKIHDKNTKYRAMYSDRRKGIIFILKGWLSQVALR